MILENGRIWSFLCFLFLHGCSGGSSSDASNPTGTTGGSGIDYSRLQPSCFSAAADPILKSGDLMTGSAWNDPHVLKVGSQYFMYLSSGSGGDIRVYRLVSSDLSSWSLSPSTPVFQKSSSGSAWDSEATETPGVVQFNGTYYLFYTGYSDFNNVGTFRIGYATSTDGVTWTRASSSALIAPTDPSGAPNGDFHQYLVGEPAPVVFNGKIHLYFTAVGVDMGLGTTLQTLGLVTSSDGAAWSAPQKVLTPDQALYPRASGWVGYSTPHAAVLNSQMHLFFDVVNETGSWTQVKLHHAVSTDGVSSWTQDSQALLDHSQFTWTSREIRSPAVLLEGTKLYLWYAGDDGTTLGLGRAVCDLGG